ncbi:MAG: guanosine monophosphate reductase [Candidatus Methanoperedens sp.]|nr:guanosine monophosphate reductase [Candidatus Methanoperedens sp.]
MKETFTFDDVLIKQRFSYVPSRKDVSLKSSFKRLPSLELPIISANMDTITGSRMARAMSDAGAIGCLHRFCDTEKNKEMFYDAAGPYMGDMTAEVTLPMISIGVGDEEIARAEALLNCGANVIVVDVAHGSQMSVANQVKNLRNALGDDFGIIVGNFSNERCVTEFFDTVRLDYVDGIKVGVGPGSACTTRIKTGVGYPQLSAILEIAACLKNYNIAVIADGGMRTAGDVAKALGAGAHFAMLGGMLAGTDETPGDIIEDKKLISSEQTGPNTTSKIYVTQKFKKYRGSASKESYDLQGKNASWRAAEGESFVVPYKGPVSATLEDIEAGIRGAMTYTGSRTLQEFHERCEFVRVSPSTVVENGAHGKR